MYENFGLFVGASCALSLDFVFSFTQISTGWDSTCKLWDSRKLNCLATFAPTCLAANSLSNVLIRSCT